MFELDSTKMYEAQARERAVYEMDGYAQALADVAVGLDFTSARNVIDWANRGRRERGADNLTASESRQVGARARVVTGWTTEALADWTPSPRGERELTLAERRRSELLDRAREEGRRIIERRPASSGGGDHPGAYDCRAAYELAVQLAETTKAALVEHDERIRALELARAPAAVNDALDDGRSVCQADNWFGGYAQGVTDTLFAERRGVDAVDSARALACANCDRTALGIISGAGCGVDGGEHVWTFRPVNPQDIHASPTAASRQA